MKKLNKIHNKIGSEMKLFKILFIISALILIIFSEGYSQNLPSENLFYLTSSNNSFESFKKNIDKISIIAPSAYYITENGSLWGSVNKRVLELSAEHNVKVMPLIINIGEASFDDKLIHAILENESACKRAIEMMLDLAKKNNFYGWQFDIENLNIADRDKFTKFYEKTAKALHQEGFKLSAAVVHQIATTPGHNAYHNFLFEDWRAGYDLKAMAEAGDFISIMTYDQHTRRTPPGPVSGFRWAESVIKFFIEQGVPASKISLGIPSYSVFWFPDYNSEKGGFVNARHLNYGEAIGLTERYDTELKWLETQGCYYTYWENDGVFEYLFLEDANSFEAKLKLLSKYNLRGISVWRTGSEDPAIWDVIEKKLTTIKR
ncbi:glycosyl hydrolase family 18 protein [Bacteroidota bacterium]